MLLSTDWFFNYWPVLGISVPVDQKLPFMNGCRPIVEKMLIVHGARVDEYWLTNFSDERIAGTRQEICDLLDAYRIDSQNAEVILAGLKRKHNSIKLGPLEEITMLFMSGEADDILPNLDTTLTEPFTERWNSRALEGLDLTGCCLNSSSVWDRYIATLTPPIVDCLASHCNKTVMVSQLEYVWCCLGEILTVHQKAQLVEWYQVSMGRLYAPEYDLAALYRCGFQNYDVT
jgi:hypothetical protein